MKYFFLCLPVILTVGVLALVSPSEVITYVGTDNAYLLMFATALIGGLSFFVGVPYVAMLITLALGDLNPYILGIVTACGVLCGDSVAYFFATRLRRTTSSTQNLIQKIDTLYETSPRYLPLLFLVYGAVSPFPNDLLTVSAGYAKYGFFKTMLPLFAGNVVFCIAIARGAVLFA
jgi:membrane protein YqaA with SNARE-associated domain